MMALPAQKSPKAIMVTRIQKYANLEYETQYSRFNKFKIITKALFRNIPKILLYVLIISAIALLFTIAIITTFAKNSAIAYYAFIIVFIICVLSGITTFILHAFALVDTDYELEPLRDYPSKEDFISTQNETLYKMLTDYLCQCIFEIHNDEALSSKWRIEIEKRLKPIIHAEIIKQQRVSKCNTSYEGKIQFYRWLTVDLLNIMINVIAKESNPIFDEYMKEVGWAKPERTIPKYERPVAPKPIKDEPKSNYIPAKSYWTCSYCGQKVDNKHLSCPHCLGIRLS